MPVDLGGSRHYSMPVQAPWVCPACGTEQTSRLEDGCPSCGSGRPGSHVVGMEASSSTSTASTPSTPPVPLSSSAIDLPTFLRQGFNLWWTPRRAHEKQRPLDDAHLLEAFIAGYEFAMNLQYNPAALRQEREDHAEPVFSSAGKEARTLAAALALFIENTLRIAEDVVESGEWCSIEEAQQLLKKLHEEGSR